MTLTREPMHFKTVWLDMPDTLPDNIRRNHHLRVRFVFDSTLRTYTSAPGPQYYMHPFDVHLSRTDKLWERMTKDEKDEFSDFEEHLCDELRDYLGHYPVAVVEKQQPESVDEINNDKELLDELLDIEENEYEAVVLLRVLKETWS